MKGTTLAMHVPTRLQRLHVLHAALICAVLPLHSGMTAVKMQLQRITLQRIATQIFNWRYS